MCSLNWEYGFSWICNNLTVPIDVDTTKKSFEINCKNNINKKNWQIYSSLNNK